MANESGSNRPNRPMRPRQGAPGQRRKRRVVIDSSAARPPRDARQQRDRQDGVRPKQQREVAAPTGPVSVPSGVTVRDLSQALGVPAPKIIMFMMGLGKAVTITQSLGDDEVELIAAELAPDRELTIKHAADEDEEPEVFEDSEADLAPRPPVVTIMGHVDHGKTTLLDAIRQTSVVETEAGGITQHIGAYQVQHDGRKITFLDTPGHEAFTAMRARGAKVTDIAVLVVAADDGVMPQTKESISHARAAEVPIVVAVNKIDVDDADPNRVRSELSGEGLQPEEWGGTTQFSDVSAKQIQNLDDLLEKVLLVADAELELTANPNAEASGPIIESRLDIGRGPVATMLVHRGTLRVGDAVVAGDAWGKVRALYNFRGDKVKDAKPGDPVEILGFDKPPPAGELCRVVENERRARELANVRGERVRREQLAQASKGVSIESLFEQMQAGAVQDLNLVVKGDVVGSVEAAVSELSKIQHPEVRVNVIHQGVGGITEGDIMLASASSATVVGFNVRPNAEARTLAEREGVEIRTYRVIYQLTEDIEQALVGMLRPVEKEETLGEAEVRQLFKVSRLGTIAGCMVTSGLVRRGAKVRVVRDGTLIHETTIAQLKRFKDDAREVAEGFECGILLDGFNDVKEGDVLEAYETREVERTTLDEPAPAATT
jgi:translation initiation factor IF-2